ncbi:MAG: PhzF family phenazine biosynthesis protein [Myxococcales bacterium]
MTRLRFHIVNVFTQGTDRLSGNPLCVFEDGRALDSRTMQALARQFNLSETTFLLPSERANARIRIFTPGFEMPFAGHPTLGSAFVARSLGLAASDDLTLEMEAGVIPVCIQQRPDGGCARCSLDANTPRIRAFEPSLEHLASALGLTQVDVARALWVDAGNEQLVVSLASEAAVRNVKPQLEALRPLFPAAKPIKVYLFVETTPGRAFARFFFCVGESLFEDPATGSATANLGGFMIATQRALPLSLEIAQGEYTGRPSTLLLGVASDGRVSVAGDVVELARGELEL